MSRAFTVPVLILGQKSSRAPFIIKEGGEKGNGKFPTQAILQFW
jgi:hypothetical protein